MLDCLKIVEIKKLITTKKIWMYGVTLLDLASQNEA